MEREESINVNKFAQAVENAVNYTYQGINNPVEGTILTVMKDWSESLKELQNKSSDFAEVIEESLETAWKSLMKTKTQLEVLKKDDVVDSGAQAFVLFLEGIVDFIRDGNLKDLKVETVSHVESLPEEEIGIEEELKFRYCTEAYLANLKIELTDLREKISDLGDLLIVAADNNKLNMEAEFLEPISPIVAMNAGRGSTAVVIIEKN